MMTGTVMVIGLLVMFFVAIGAPGMSFTPANAAGMMKADKAMMKATGDDLMVFNHDLAIL